MSTLDLGIFYFCHSYQTNAQKLCQCLNCLHILISAHPLHRAECEGREASSISPPCRRRAPLTTLDSQQWEDREEREREKEKEGGEVSAEAEIPGSKGRIKGGE